MMVIRAIIILFGLSLLLNINVFGASVPFDSKEDCSSIQGEIKACKNAVIKACQWISKYGMGKLKDKNKALAKISKSRFCKTNYVWVEPYLENLSAETKGEVKLILHPVKPGLQKVNLLHKAFYGHYLIHKFNLAAQERPKGCWVPYRWTKPGKSEEEDKISYVVRCKDKDSGKVVITAGGIYASPSLVEGEPLCSIKANPLRYRKK